MYCPALSRFDFSVRSEKFMRFLIQYTDKKYFQPELPTTMLTCLPGAEPLLPPVGPAKMKHPQKAGRNASKKERKGKEQKRKKPS